MSADKYPTISLRQVEVIVYLANVHFVTIHNVQYVMYFALCLDLRLTLTLSLFYS